MVKRRPKARIDNPTERVCKTCQTVKPISSFQPQNSNRDQDWVTYRHTCVDCNRAKSRERHADKKKLLRTCIDCGVPLELRRKKRCSPCAVLAHRLCVRRTTNPVSCDEKLCRGCDEVKKSSFFYVSKRSKDGLEHYCKRCRADKGSTRRKTHEANGLCHCGRASEEGFKTCNLCRVRRQTWGSNNRDYIQETGLAWRIKVREQVLNHYGTICACCYENQQEFLTIDHIKGGGNQHRKEVGSGPAFYSWLIKQNFPEGYQTLCYNCNCSKGHLGYCPHDREELRQKINARLELLADMDSPQSDVTIEEGVRL